MNLSEKCFIAVAGNIGAGKSTLTRMLSNALNWQPFFEADAENPYLADFYADMQRWSFHSQVFYLGRRLEHHRLLVDHRGCAVQDRTVYEDAEIFARNLYESGLMSERDYDAYRHLYVAVASFLPPPDVIVYLEASVDTLVSHIAKRGRDYERDIKPEYLARLNSYYEDWIGNWTRCPVLRINVDGIDFAENPDDFAAIVAAVESQMAAQML
jgi:deoxyadenosine/deoxycytidine kinase